MVTVGAIAANLFETIGLVRPSIEVMVREPEESGVARLRLHMCWIRDVDSSGRRVIRIQWIEDKNSREDVNV